MIYKYITKYVYTYILTQLKSRKYSAQLLPFGKKPYRIYFTLQVSEKQYVVKYFDRMKDLKSTEEPRVFTLKCHFKHPLYYLPLLYSISFPSLVPAYLTIPESAIFIRKTNCIHIILPARYAKSFPIENLPFTN